VTQRPTLREVARRAGCSVTTTSNILQGRHRGYRPETVERVLSVAHALGYRPNRAAQSLAKNRSYTIALVFERYHPILTRNSYAQHVVDGILERLFATDYDLKMVMFNPSAPEQLWGRVQEGAVDGALLLVPAIDSPLLEWRRGSSVPAVSINSTVPALYQLSSIDIDNESAMQALTEWVLEQGHRDIGFIKGHPLHWSAHQRERAFRRVLAQHGIVPREEWIFEGTYSIEGGRLAALQLLEQAALPTAVLCANDLTAVGFAQVCLERGVRIPDDLSLAGFDDDALALSIMPTLTTVAHNMQAVGRQAVEMLLELIEHPQTPFQQRLLPGRLIIRSSVRPFHTGVVQVAAQHLIQEVQR